MKQILQNISNGETQLVDVPCPKISSGQVLIKTTKSLISAGTERMLIDFGKAGLIEKARQQPDKVKMVLGKVMTDGLMSTINTVRSKLDQPLPLGYCNVGRVIEADKTPFKTGDRVISNGNHAEVVRVPCNLVAKIPDNVSDEDASYTVLGAIALQGIRLVQPTIGETIVVTGLGLIGLLTVQMLKANGCRVMGIDFDSAKCELARKFGAETVDLSKGQDTIQAAEAFSRGQGVDAVIITASAKTNDIMHQAATMCRKRGRIVLVGVVGLELRRSDFFEKELTFQVSCSYGPGRYDDVYEQKGQDYPLPYVRWTEGRNFEAVLDLMDSGVLDIESLISHRFSIDQAVEGYKILDDSSTLGIILDYPHDNVEDLTKNTVTLSSEEGTKPPEKSAVRIAFLGAGNYASRVLMPAFKKAGPHLVSVISSGGVSGVHHGKKNGLARASTEIKDALSEDINTVVIATRHDQHAAQTIEALKAGKHVFVEKPLALTSLEIDQIEKTYNAMSVKKHIMVGYNRRFSPHVMKMKELLSSKNIPKTFIMTMNAGDIPTDHWTQDAVVGGGRIIGEACHYIDLMRYLSGAPITSFHAEKIGSVPGVSISEDKAIITLTFEDGSVGSIHYFANGGKVFPKERIEVFCDDAVLQLDNFRKLKGFGWKAFKQFRTWSQDKGQKNCITEFIAAIEQGKACPINVEEIFEVAKISVAIAESLRK